MHTRLLIVFSLLIGHTSFANSEWPPVKGAEVSGIEFINHRGVTKKLAHLSGRATILEFVGMNCPACNGFAGGNSKPIKYKNMRSQKGLKSFDKYFERFSKVGSIRNANINFIHILIFDIKNKPTSIEDAKSWHSFYGSKFGPKFEVWVPKKDLTGISYDLIPGFALIDRHGKYQSLSVGPVPKTNLYTEFLPIIKNFL